MMLPIITAIVASIIGTRLGFTVVAMPRTVRILANIRLAEAAFSATLSVIKNKMTGNKSNKNFMLYFQ
jgi:hypothetical protein